MENDSIVFTDEDGNEVAFSVMEQTTLGGVNYLLVTEDGDHALPGTQNAGSLPEDPVRSSV